MQPQGLSCPLEQPVLLCVCARGWVHFGPWEEYRCLGRAGSQPRGATGVKEDCSRVRADGVGALSLGMCHLLMGEVGVGAAPHSADLLFRSPHPSSLFPSLGLTWPVGPWTGPRLAIT